VDEFNDELIRRLQQLPAVKSVGLTSVSASSRATIANNAFIPEGYVPPPGANMNLATAVQVQAIICRRWTFHLLWSLLYRGADTENNSASGDCQPQLRRALLARFGPHRGSALRIGTTGDANSWMTHCWGSRRREGELPDAPNKEQYYEPVEQFEKSLGSLASAYRSEWQRRLHRCSHGDGA